MVPSFRPWSLSAVAVALLACGGGGGGVVEPGPGPGPGPSPNPSTASVNMTSGVDGYGYESNVFSPGAVTIARNGTVSWINSTGVAHSVAFSTSGAPANIPSHTTGTNSRTFANAGTFNYSCTNHPTMVGSVTVQ